MYVLLRIWFFQSFWKRNENMTIIAQAHIMKISKMGKEKNVLKLKTLEKNFS